MMKVDQQFKKAWELINKSQKIFMTTHEGTDGDDLGSLLAVRAVLLKLNKQVTAAVKEGVPSSLRFLPAAEEVSDQFQQDNYDLCIIFGCRDIKRTGIGWLASAAPIINFDHHPDNTDFGTINIVQPQTSSVAELVYYFLKSGEVAIDKNIATSLLTGIFTDTGGFKHANTTAEALEVAAQLMKKGARIDKIAFNTMSKHKPQTVKAWAKGLENTRFDRHQQMVFSVLTQDDLIDAGATDEDLDGFVELLNNIPQAKFSLVLRQAGEVVKGSLRSEPHKGIDVSAIARQFGGGGHKLASGFKIKGKLVKDKDVWKIV